MAVSVISDTSLLPRPWRGVSPFYQSIQNLAQNYGPNSDPNQTDQNDPIRKYLNQLGGQATENTPQGGPSTAAQDLMGRLSSHMSGNTTRGLTPGAPAMTAPATAAGQGSSTYLTQLQSIGAMGTAATARQNAIQQFQAAQNAAKTAAGSGGGSFPNIGNVSGARAKAIAAARTQLGVPYVWGGESPGKGFDCSGLVQWAYRRAGINLPRVAAQQMTTGVVTSIRNLVPGDLVGVGHPAHHIMLYLGGGKVIEAPHTGDHVKIISLSNYGPVWGIHLRF